MNKRRQLPFLVAPPKPQAVAIGSPDVGIIHLLKRGHITTAENPADLQAEIKKQAQILLLNEKASQRLATAKGISVKEARKQLSAAPTKNAEDGSNLEEEEMPTLFEYLEASEAAELLSLQADRPKTMLRAAELLIQSRVVYPVQVAVEAKPRATKLHVEPIGFPLQEGQQIRVGNVVVTLTKYADIDAEELEIEPLKAPIEASAIGYLLDESGKKLKAGDPEWSDADTYNLPEPLIVAIYQFYELENGRVREEGSDDAGKTSTPKPLSDTSQALPLTGETSFGDFNGTESEMNGSTMKTLVNSQ